MGATMARLFGMARGIASSHSRYNERANSKQIETEHRQTDFNVNRAVFLKGSGEVKETNWNKRIE